MHEKTSEETRAALFQEHRPLLLSVAHRMLGSTAEAEDAVQETWLRLARTTERIDNPAGWLTTVTGRICLDLLRSRTARREDPADRPGTEPADPDPGPEHRALTADAVSTALLVVLDALTPAERLAFILHDVFAVPFDDIAPLLERTPAATRQLASRARRRLRGTPAPATTATATDHHDTVVQAFLTAARGGDLTGLLTVLDPQVTARGDVFARLHGVPALARGADTVAAQAVTFSRLAHGARPVRVDGRPGFLSLSDHRPTAVLLFTVTDGRITAIDIHYDPDLLTALA
ncbi:sigma-70 family RNA polymerase sigma factor [Nocardiopsis changdeensis]|uniref:Sigma-70 family RNA polymerase sigma factor n=1 Tax=Nocardiopsis changdeensis TaxID=2831969 RepID=A0ABX8BT47_9ACTN|nr:MULTISPECIES: sigma-70 family RNA polymerase sigma factor [Nocardiopsis]QUX25427.1 sigma-70 family RNA polymerase sigma factor [Nocardiopsis changdeensis]QYX35813.1 sigma-70 family RNA polymerase sigma factor [Nocardiopsis sp. MT53]